MTGRYCVDANIFITSWNTAYPIQVFPSLWQQISKHRSNIILIKPVFDEIDPISPSDQRLAKNERQDKYPLRVWMENNQFAATLITDATNSISLNLEKDYETNNNPKGANQNDITLIAYAKSEDKIVVTFEEKQPQLPGKKCNYKIPLICDEQQVECISFVEMLSRLGIKI